MKKLNWLVVMLVLGLGSQGAGAAKLYKWVDEFGNVSYRDTPPVEDGADYQEANIDGGNSSITEGDEATAAAAEAAPVVLYSAPSCGPCESARRYLDSRGVPYQDKNVDGNRDVQKELKDKTGQLSVPTILVGQKVMKGYVQSLLAGELDAAGYPKAGGGNGASATTAAEEQDTDPDFPDDKVEKEETDQ